MHPNIFLLICHQIRQIERNMYLGSVLEVFLLDCLDIDALIYIFVDVIDLSVELIVDLLIIISITFPLIVFKSQNLNDFVNR